MKVADRLAELCAIRDRDLTDEEQREAMKLARCHRWNGSRKRRYHSDPDYRRITIARNSGEARRSRRLEAAE